MAFTPYSDQPNSAFWSRSVAKPSVAEVFPVTSTSFKINASTKVATAGSCFAQHISKYLNSIGIKPLVTETAHPIVNQFSSEYQYGLYSARYGNIYTSRQLVQLFDRAYGQIDTGSYHWQTDGKFHDPFRPGIPNGFGTLEELTRDRAKHLESVRNMFEQLDVFIFTLGLTETWENIESSIVYPSCPGAIAGTFDPLKHRFKNLSVNEIVDDMSLFMSKLRSVNPKAKVILTVSPVPLIATASNDHVLPATVYSKSVLRVAAQMIKESFSDVDYFPSYEIITGVHSRGAFFSEDLRTVKPEGVALVMKTFAKAYLSNDDQLKSTSDRADSGDFIDELQNSLNLVCEELYNEATNS